jgi:hypothetical protein
MRMQECPSLWACCVVKFEAVRAIVEFDVEDEGLVAILQKRDGLGLLLRGD